MNVILPGILTSCVLLSVFFCTPAQKVHIGVAALLSFRLFLLNVADTIPRTSDHVPLLGIYLTSTMAITTLAMVSTVFVLNLHHAGERPVPKWAKKLFFVFLARLFCMCSFCKLPPSQDSRRESHSVRSSYASSSSDHQRETRPSIAQASPFVLSVPSRKKSVASYDRKLSKEGGEKNPDYSKDWKRLAEVFDRLFFFICLIAIIATTLVLFHPITTAKWTKTSS